MSAMDIEQLNNITSADLVVIAQCEMVATAGVKVQGFAENEAVTMDGRDLAVSKLGVDGFFAAGFKYSKSVITLKVLASSPFLETIRQCMAIQEDIPRMLQWDMDITYPALNRTYHCSTGILKTAKEIPDAKDALDDVTLQFEFRQVRPQSLGRN